MCLPILPKTGVEKQQHAIHFQTAYQHQEGQNPFGRIGQGVPRVGGAVIAESKACVADA